MIKEIEPKDLPECVQVIRESFATVAEKFGFTEENAPQIYCLCYDTEAVGVAFEQGTQTHVCLFV